MSEFQIPRRGLIAALAILAPLLGACSSGPSIPSFSSMFGSSDGAANANASGAPSLPANFECPPVQVRQGAATMTNYSNTAGEPTATNLRYQVSIGTTARECKLNPGNMLSIKVGVQGRVIVGPEGGPSAVIVPLRFAVVHELVDAVTITTKLDRINVTMPPGDGNVLFTHVADGLDFPMPKGNAIDNYVIYIGFDPAGLEPERKKPAPKPRPKAIKQSRQTG